MEAKKTAAMRSALYPAILVLLLSGKVPAQDWARKMFPTTSHDFGTVARGAKAEFEFPVEINFKLEVHIASVRSSCGCTTLEITKPRLQTGEKGVILAKYNTRSFLGQRNATITVTMDEPYYAEVQLMVTGYIRSDVVLHPGSLEFGDVELGTSSEKKLSIDYAGRDDWKIVDVRSTNSHFEAVLTEKQRTQDRTTYDLDVRLKDDAPAGYINEQLLLVTSDQNRDQIPFLVTGRVVPAITVSPAALSIGVVASGDKITKQLVVRASRPFRITAVQCADECFSFKTTSQPKRIHLIPVTFTADKPGRISQAIQIQTDLAPGAPATCIVTATVKPSVDHG